jgi:hypothetical protein
MEISTEVSQKSKNMFGSIVYTFNCNYSEDGDQEDQGSKPTGANSSPDSILNKLNTSLGWWSVCLASVRS